MLQWTCVEKTTQPNSSWCRHYKAIPCHRAVSQRHLREGSRLTMCTGKSIKRKHIFFSGLITACLTRALCCYLQASTFIPTRCDTSQVPPLPPPADFAPVPSYLASIQRRLLGTGLYWELLLIASPTSSSYTSTVLLALSAGLLPCEMQQAYEKQQRVRAIQTPIIIINWNIRNLGFCKAYI